MPLLIRTQLHLFALLDGFCRRLVASRDERGQATAEYALVLVAAVAIAGLLVTWARRTNLLDSVLDKVFQSLLPTGASAG